MSSFQVKEAFKRGDINAVTVNTLATGYAAYRCYLITFSDGRTLSTRTWLHPHGKKTRQVVKALYRV